MIRLERDDEQLLLVVLYVLAVALTTSVSGAYGPLASVLDSLPGIGLVIAVRIRLQDLWRGRVYHRMIPLVLLGSLGSLSGNMSHPRIAGASCAAFIAANLASMWLQPRSRLASITAFAVIDSLIFPPLAFSAFAWWVVGGQIAAKIFGAVVWGWVFLGLFGPRGS